MGREDPNCGYHSAPGELAKLGVRVPATKIAPVSAPSGPRGLEVGPRRAERDSMRLGRPVRWLLALVVFAVVLVATGPTIWRDGISNLETYLHVSKAVAMGLIVGPLALIVLVPAFLRVRNRLRVRQQHEAAHAEALRHLHG